MGAFIKLIRVKQWVKNGFIFFPAFFADVLNDSTLVMELVAGFFAFSLTASAVYVLNDWFDAPMDRLHPEKKNRPIASGEIRTERVMLYVSTLLFAGLGIGVAIEPKFAMLLMVYFGMNFVYSAGIKNFPVLDISIISFGFILRILCGGEIAHVPISKWMIIVTFCLSMFLAFAKRRSDFVLFTTQGKETRKSIRFYTKNLINVGLILTALLTVVFYILYTLSDSVTARIHENLYLTAIFVAMGMGWYLYLTYYKNLSGKPTEVLYKDRILQVIIACWVGSIAWFMYGA